MTLTSNAGFSVPVQAPIAGTGEPRLMVFNGVTDQHAERLQTSSFSLPFDAFSHTHAEAVISLRAMQLDGSPLPPWMIFDAQSGTFQVTPPADFNGELKIIVIASDGLREARTQFKFTVGETKSQIKPFVKGRAGLSEQLHASARLVSGDRWSSESSTFPTHMQRDSIRAAQREVRRSS